MVTAFKHLHLTCAFVSMLGFIIRCWWRWSQNEMLNKKWVKVAPHIVDSLLLASAIFLCVLIGQYPFVAGWVTVKVVALILYIALGLIALKHAQQRPHIAMAAAGALLTFAFIASVAVSKDPLGFLANAI